jgi:hypothetical protein
MSWRIGDGLEGTFGRVGEATSFAVGGHFSSGPRDCCIVVDYCALVLPSASVERIHGDKVKQMGILIFDVYLGNIWY